MNINENEWKTTSKVFSLRELIRPIAPDAMWTSDVWLKRPAYPQPRSVEELKRLIITHPNVVKAIREENERINMNKKTIKTK